jgi:hypothetical protein
MPTLRERLKLARQVLTSPYTPEAGTQVDRILRGVISPGRGEPPNRNTASRLQAYNDMPWLRAVGERIATDVAAVEWELFLPRRGGKPAKDLVLRRAGSVTRKAQIARRRKDISGNNGADLEPVEQHPFLDLVMGKGSELLPGNATRKVQQLHMDLTGESFSVKERDGLQTIVALWPVPSNWVIGTPSPSYPFFTVVYRQWRQDIAATEMLWMKNPDPVNPYARGSGMVGSIGDELDTDEYASKFIKQFFYNDATPAFMVYPKGGDNAQMTETEAKRLEVSWLNKMQGMFRAGRPIFPTREVGVYEFEKNFRQMQMVDLRRYLRDIVRQVPGLPPEILGIQETGSNRATIDGAQYIYAKQVLVSRLEMLRAFYQQVVDEYDERFVLDYVSPVQEDREYELNVIKAAPYAFKVDEIRKRAGEPALDAKQGEVFGVPMGITMHESLEPAPEIDPLAENPPPVVPPKPAAPKEPVA